jgi:hypothetical protein
VEPDRSPVLNRPEGGLTAPHHGVGYGPPKLTMASPGAPTGSPVV